MEAEETKGKSVPHKSCKFFGFFFQLMYCCKSTLEAPYATCDEVCFECVDNVHVYKRFF